MVIWLPLESFGSGPAEPSPPRDEIAIVSANVLKFKELDGFLSRYAGMPESGQNPEVLYPGLGFAARSGTEVLGVVLFHLLASLVPGEDLCFLFGAVNALHRRRGVGTRLMTEALSSARRAVARPVFIVTLPERDPEPAAFLSRLGFEEIDSQIHYERKLVAPEHVGEDSRFDVRQYRGGDPLLDSAIMDLHRRAYRDRSGTPDLTVNLLAQRLVSNCRYELLFRGGQLIGYSSFWINQGDCFSDCISVDPQYWGSGASDALALAVVRAASELGCATISTNSTSSDRPACKLCDRHGFLAVKVTRRFCQRFTGDA